MHFFKEPLTFILKILTGSSCCTNFREGCSKPC